MQKFKSYGHSSETYRNTYLKRVYGISVGQYDALMIKQKDKCAVCRTPQSELPRRFAVDHDHNTGKVRGLLCQRCNLCVIPTVEYYTKLIPLAKRYLKLSPIMPTLTDKVQGLQ